MKHPDTAALAREALESTGLKHHDFAGMIQVGVRTLRAWLAGEKPAPPIAQMVLREVKGGWRPSA